MLMVIPTTAVAQQSTINHTAFIEAGHTRFSQTGADTDGFYSVGTVYLEQVGHGSLPHNQASFLERASSVVLAYGDLIGDYAFVGKRSVDIRSVDLQYISKSHWIFGAGYNNFEIDTLSDTTRRTLTLGRYLSDSSRFLVTAGVTDAESAFVDTSDAKTFSLEYKNVTLRVDNTAVTFDMKYNHSDSDAGNSDEVSVHGEYHLSLATSISAEGSRTWGQASGKGLGIGLNHYFTPFLALGVKHARSDPDQQADGKTFSAFVRLLF